MAGPLSLRLSELWRKQRGRLAYCETFVKKYSYMSMCTPVKTLRRTRAWRHPVQAVRGGRGVTAPSHPPVLGRGVRGSPGFHLGQSPAS